MQSQLQTHSFLPSAKLKCIESRRRSMGYAPRFQPRLWASSVYLIAARDGRVLRQVLIYFIPLFVTTTFETISYFHRFGFYLRKKKQKDFFDLRFLKFER
jgi:hypothetical protein